ncbi:MAG: hypothetical protein KAY24_12855 [Candidatus Eisenbacteria sp.]|nr:hypothetical protein [Candidatus Eisenbacteria bacterium]
MGRTISATVWRAPGFIAGAFLIALIVVLCVWADAGYGDGRTHAQSDVSRGLPLRFDSEIVRLFIEDDSLKVEGTYRLLCRPRRVAIVSLLFPYPVDSLLGGARTSCVKCRVPGGNWQAVSYEELPQRMGARWMVPLDLGDTLDVHTVYHQAILASYARYIVTTTSAWGRPLRKARFEIYLPEDARDPQFSFPFEYQVLGDRSCYCFEAIGFMPDRDITVSWNHASDGRSGTESASH